MPYERSLLLEKRLQSILALLDHGKHSTPTLAQELRVSEPTISRCLTALRKRGHSIRASKNGNGWSYQLLTEHAASVSKESVA